MPAPCPHPGLADLPWELLRLIVEPLGLRERVRLSCCSKGLLRRLSAAAGLYDEVELEPASEPEARSLVPWLHRHRHAIRSLSLDLDGLADASPLQPHWHAAFLVGALGGGALERLTIRVEAGDGEPAAELKLSAWLADLPHLSTLLVVADEVSAATSFSCLPGLTRLVINRAGYLPAGCLPPSLRSLTLYTEVAPDDDFLPAVAQATGLQELVINGVVDDFSGLQHLAALTSLDICLGDDGESDPLVPLTGLRALTLVVTGQVWEEDFEQLAALSMLTRLMICSGKDGERWYKHGRVIGHLPGTILALPELEELVLNTARPPTSLRPLPPGGTPVLQELALSTATAAQGAEPATLASLTSLTSLLLYGLTGAYYNKEIGDGCYQIPIPALAALMAALGSLPRLHSLEWVLVGFGLTPGRPQSWKQQRAQAEEVEEARDAEEAAAAQALQSGVRLPAAGGTGPPESLRDVRLAFSRVHEYWWAAGHPELTHKLGLASWVAAAVHVEWLSVQGAGEVVAEVMRAAAPPGAEFSTAAWME